MYVLKRDALRADAPGIERFPCGPQGAIPEELVTLVPGFSLDVSSSRLFAARMKLAINTLQPVQRDMRINLCSGNICVAKNGLHGAQVSAVFYHVRGATVAQHMRTGVSSPVGS